MALPLGKLTLLIGAGLVGSVLAKEGRFSKVSDFLSGVGKIAFDHRQNDSMSTVSKPRNDSLMAQVNSLREELQMLASNRPITIVTATRTGSTKYGAILVVVVIGYGYFWWKGWKLPDMMFATRRSLSDACTSIGQQLENVYASIRSTRRQLSSNIDRVDSNLNEVLELTANTQAKVTELREDSERIGHDVRYVRDAVETLELKISRIEGKQDLTNIGVKKLCDYAYSLENNLVEENGQAPQSSARITFSSKIGSLPSSSLEFSSPSTSNGSTEHPMRNAASSPGQQMSNGISGVIEVSSSHAISNGIGASEETNNGSSSWFRPSFISRTRTATNTVLQRMGSSRQQS